MKHLNSLSVKNFKCLEDFSIEKLGDVNLIVGANNSGKSTVLEAIRVYASRGDKQVLRDILRERKNPKIFSSFDGYAHFFTGRAFPEDADVKIQIGNSHLHLLTIEHGYKQKREIKREAASGEVVTETREILLPKPLTEEQQNKRRMGELKLEDSLVILNTIQLNTITMQTDFSVLSTLSCGVIAAGAPSVTDIAKLWAGVTSPQQENEVLEVLRWLEPNCFALKIVPDGEAQNVLVSLGGDYVPLGSLGDGVRHLLYLVLQAQSAKNGFLLIDEIENGLHYSVQDKVWRLLFKLAKQFDIQIFATTHSWDAVESFKRIALEEEDAEGILLRVGKSAKKGDNGKTVSVVYEKDRFHGLTQHGFEVR